MKLFADRLIGKGLEELRACAGIRRLSEQQFSQNGHSVAGARRSY